MTYRPPTWRFERIRDNDTARPLGRANGFYVEAESAAEARATLEACAPGWHYRLDTRQAPWHAARGVR